MTKKKPESSSSGWVQVVVGLAVVVVTTTGAGHNPVTSPQPTAVCAQLRVLARAS